jgi:TatD DNase family protein
MHCHVDLYPHYAAVAQEAAAQNVWVLAVTTTPTAFQGTVDRLKEFPNIKVGLGLHPELAHVRASELPLLESLIGETPFIGEVGLDGSPPYREHGAIQRHVFKRVLRLCSTHGGSKVLSIHSRRAAAEVLDCFVECRDYGVAILHWFTGTKSDLALAVKLDCWFSVGPAMLESRTGIERVRAMPRGRVLLETDGPFGKVNSQVLEPPAVYDALAKLAVIWAVDYGEAMTRIENNQREIWTTALGSDAIP